MRDWVQVHPRDNVGIVVRPEGFEAAEHVPQSHKVTLAEIEVGQPVIRYGHVIGFANRTIPVGHWVREDLLDLPPAPPLSEMPLATATPPDPEPLDGVTFEGFVNANGSVGTKNILGITTTVQCVAPTVEYAVRRIKSELLPRFPNVDDVVAITHSYGCGVAIDAPGAAVPIRTIAAISTHANIGGHPLVVTLGCEKLQPERLFTIELPTVRLQSERGFAAMVASILEAAEKRLAELDRRRRTTVAASELCVGLQCGGSDGFSGITCNPAVGYAADLLVRAGATVLFSEVTEVRDAAHLISARAVNEDVARAFLREMAWYDEYLARGGADRAANTSPGNKRGGLSNIVEKSLGSVAKAGTTALRAVATHGERVRSKGLVFAATPASDFICGTQQLTSMNMHVFTTGEGTPYGLALVPVIKVSSRTALAEKWPDLIDIDAGRIATGESTIEAVGREIFDFVIETASGRRRTWAEHWGLANALAPFNPGPVT